MTKTKLCIVALATLLVGGCAKPPQAPVLLSQEALRPAGRMGVVMTALPKADTHIWGADCLLCLAVASAANSALTEHAKSLPLEDLPKLKADIASTLRKKGIDAVPIGEDLKLDALGDYAQEGPGLARKDFRPLQKKFEVDRLLVIDVTHIGFWRTYSSYIPTSDPKGVFKALGYIVNLRSNTYDWYQQVDVQKSADRTWDEPPKFPGLTNSYFQAIELGRDSLLEPFGK